MILCLVLVAGACGDGGEPAPDTAGTTAGTQAEVATTGAETFSAGVLGAVEVGSGEEIQIRSLNAITGDVAFLGIPNQRGVELAIADYGPIAGRSVSLGTGLDDLCSPDGGQASAQTIVADPSVVGVIGTSCSGAAVAASPLISNAGLVMISPSNTSPALTSDLAGTAGSAYQPGYYRTAHNDLFQGRAVALFVRNELGLNRAAAIHDGDPYTQGLAQAFADAFEELGGEVSTFTAVNKGDTDMTAVLTEVAAGGPQVLFFPIFMPEGGFIVQQVGGVAGLDGVTLIAADGLLTDNFMELPESEGVYMSGPDLRFGSNRNSITGKTADDFLAAYQAAYGEAPSAAFWAHAYDATTMLLRAIDRVAVEVEGTLHIDRASLRDELSRSNFDGIIGAITCDEYGDCGSQLITVVHHTDSRNIEAGKSNVVFGFAPTVAMMTDFSAGVLGAVEVGSGEEIQIRSLNAITGDVAFLGIPNQRGVELAIADYGPIAGRSVSLGTGLDDLCSPDGGQASAQTIVADPSVVGVIGTSCSGAAVAASPLISNAGLVMISPSNTSPALTSDLAGTAGSAYQPGYYRTAHNDLFQGRAVALFVRNELGLNRAAAIHDGDPYTQGLAQAFADAFEELGGEVSTFTAVNKGDTDMTAVLTEVAAGGPQVLFFPIFMPEGGFIVQQVGGVAGLDGVTLIAADGLLTDNFMELPESEGVYMSGPDLRFGSNRNSITGKTADDFLAAYQAAYGEAPSAAFWAHAYDATTMLLRAIDRVAVEVEGTLHIDRASLRDELSRSNFDGIIGAITCDEYGDCGSQLITVVHHTDSRNIEAGKSNVVFGYVP
ncbi:branched-chain amino acid ABC transporter substrate-binding protein [Candidatus Spongiisocius sp.]|uniref:branched-chain amino acid ABC transporter substrate-binding protein n=1 Tax=Candidatus Spongiisocius sp. TaxID=3101273 RepID=UPI003B5A0149